MEAIENRYYEFTENITTLKNTPNDSGGNFNISIKVKKVVKILPSRYGKRILFFGEDKSGTERIILPARK